MDLDFEAIVAVMYDRTMDICTGIRQFGKPISLLSIVIRLQARCRRIGVRYPRPHCPWGHSASCQCVPEGLPGLIFFFGGGENFEL